MMSNVGLNKSFWAEAINTFFYLVNRSPSIAIDRKTPFEVWFNKQVDYSILRVFYCPAYYHVSGGKLEPGSKKRLFMGFGNGVKGYKIWSPFENKIIGSRDVIFDESYLFHPRLEVVVSRKKSILNRWRLILRQVENRMVKVLKLVVMHMKFL